MSDSMVERVARAICAEMGIDPDDNRERMLPGSYQTDDGEPHWKGYIDHARAAIAAMRDHSPEQESRMSKLLGENTPATRRWHWVWGEMIDAALSEPQANAGVK